MPKRAPAVVKLRFRHMRDDGGLTVQIDGLQIRSEPNLHQHWSKKQPRKIAQRLIVLEAMRHAMPVGFSDGPLKVVFTRLGGKRMDPGNLGNGFKVVEDAFFACIGRDDGEEEIEILYRQEPGPSHAVRISVDRV